MSMVIESLSNDSWQLTNPGGNFTNNGYPTRVPTITRPDKIAVSTGLQAVGDGVIPMGHGGAICPQWLRIIPIGVGSSSNTLKLKVIHWKATRLGIVPLWIPEVYGEWTCTLGTSSGVANSDLGTTTLFTTTITQTGGPQLTNAATPAVTVTPAIVEKWFQLSPGSNDIGSITVPSLGARYMEVIYTTGGSATSCNGLYTKL